MNSQEIRTAFLRFFESKQHIIVPSAPIVLKDDPTLMFNNSGMAQFKEYFLGNATPKSNRIADTQKCLRVSGKHNDLEDVGFVLITIQCLKCWVIGLLVIISKRSNCLGMGIFNRCFKIR